MMAVVDMCELCVAVVGVAEKLCAVPLIRAGGVYWG